MSSVSRLSVSGYRFHPCWIVLGLAFFARLAGAEPSVVKVVPGLGGGWSLTRNGEAYELRGAGGDTHLDLLKEIGGTTIRTWGIEQLDREVGGKSLLDRCHELGLTVMAGIWVQHERHGFNYSDPEQIKKQREEVREAVRKYKDHPALLIWGLGNEMEGPGSDGRDPRVWRELEQLARLVKEEDPHHPVCTVIAGAGGDKVRALRKEYTALDILGVNAYGGAAEVGRAVTEAGWTKPFILAEFGPLGHWEVGRTSWGAPIEPFARDKAARYEATLRAVMADGHGRCLGAFAFIWGQKQETTATWYGMFLASGEKLPAVDAVAHAWSGKWPANRSPHIENLTADFAGREVRPGESLAVIAEASDAEGDALDFDWQVVAESTDRREGGDRESVPPAFPECVVRVGGGGGRAELRAPATPGAYRVFLFVRDGQGGASADNLPFLVK